MSLRQKISISLFALLFVVSGFAAGNTVQSLMSLKVTKDGIHRVTAAELLAKGVNLTGFQIDNISVMHNGLNIPVRVVSDDQTTFGTNSYIEFIGNTTESLYQSGSNYQIVLRKNIPINNSSISPQDNLITEDFYVQVDTYAANNIYNFGSPILDPWYSHKIHATSGIEKSLALNFNIDNIVQDGNVSVELNIWGGVDFPESPDHHVIYQLNGTKVADFRFDGVKAKKHKFVGPGIKYQDGQQELNIVVPNDTNPTTDIISVESLIVKYPRAFVLKNKQLDFLLDDNIQTSLGDHIFGSGFDSDQVANGEIEAKAVTVNNNYRIKNANNENYIVYELKRNGQVELVNYLQSNSCVQSVNLNCDLQFSARSDSIHIYITAESTIFTPELTVPVVIFEGINYGAADFLIITHPDFIGTELDAFVASKQPEFSVKVVDVEQVYAQYGYGNVSAESIASYIKYAAQKLGVQNVLLVGGDTYDYKNYLGLSSISFIPTLYGKTDQYISHAPIDAKYADIDGDNIPDINIGRFPVRTETELANLRLKLENYNNKDYSDTIMFAADKFDVSNGYSFKEDAEFLIDVLPTHWKNNITTDNKAYIDDDGVFIAKAKINSKVNQGVALTSFVGHSGPTTWSFDSMFSSADADLLSNIQTPTVVTQWGCWNTYFVSPNENTMAHAFLLNQDGGAASVLGASTLTKAEHEKGLAKLVLQFLTVDQLSLGEAVTQAKRIYAQTNPDALDVILGWNILGDPTLRL